GEVAFGERLLCVLPELHLREIRLVTFGRQRLLLTGRRAGSGHELRDPLVCRLVGQALYPDRFELVFGHRHLLRHAVLFGLFRIEIEDNPLRHFAQPRGIERTVNWNVPPTLRPPAIPPPIEVETETDSQKCLGARLACSKPDAPLDGGVNGLGAGFWFRTNARLRRWLGARGRSRTPGFAR